MAAQGVERVRRAVAGQVFGGGADQQRQVAQLAGDEVLAGAGAGAEADVDLRLDQIGEQVGEHHIEGDAGIFLPERPDQRHQHAGAHRVRGGHADHAVVLAAAAAHLLEGLVKLAHAGLGQLEQPGALGGQAQLARGAMEQPHPEVFLQRAHRLADRLRRDLGLHGRPREALGAHHAQEQRQHPGLVHALPTSGCQ
ncbi:hypothetical protein D3C85_1265600 [compost metagenome]